MTAMPQILFPAAGHADARDLRKDEPAPHLVAIASGKGGVGKTWLAITLAQDLATRGRKVLLVDGDLGLANVDIQLGLAPTSDLSAVLSGRRSLADVIMTHTLPGASFDILPGRSGAASLANLEIGLLDHVLTSVRRLGSYHTILLDLGAGIDPATRHMAVAADTLLVVSTDEPTALADAYAVLKLHARDCDTRRTRAAPASDVSGDAPERRVDVRLIINQAASHASGRRTYDILSRACSTFLGQVPALAGIIRRDGKVPDAIRRQTTLLTRHPNSPAAEDVGRIAAALCLA